MNQGATYKLYFNSDIILAVKAIITIEAVAHILAPGVDLAEISRPMMTKIFLEQFSPMKAVQSILRVLPDYVEFQEEAPRKLLKLFDMVSSGKLQVELSHPPKAAENPAKKKISTFAYLAAGSFFGGVFMAVSPNVPGPIISSIHGLAGVPVLTAGMFLASLGSLLMVIRKLRKAAD